MKRFLMSAIIAALLLALAAPVPRAHASAQWCEDDPPVAIVTPAGNVVVVHVTNYGLGTENLPAVMAARISHTVNSTGSNTGGSARDTVVEIDVLIPNSPGNVVFDTRSVVSTGLSATGTILATASGHSGRRMELKFILPLP